MKTIVMFIIAFISTTLFAQVEAQQAFSEGVRLLNSENYLDAKKQFSKAIETGELEEGLKMSYIYKGFSYNGLGKYDSAIVCFNKALNIDSNDLATYIDRAKSFSYKSDYANAIKDFEYVIKIDSIGEQAIGAYYYLGRIKMLTNENSEAINYFDKLINLNNNDYEVYFLRGTAKSNLSKHQEAIEDFSKAIDINPNYMEAYANRGVSKLNLIPVKDKINKNIECIDEPCKDLIKAKELGDNTVEDLLYIYCKKCK